MTVIGPGKTVLIGVSGQHVAIALQKSPTVQLQGTLAISSLDVSGNGLFSAFWVNSRALRIRARDAATLQLAGVAKQLDLELWGHAEFYGRYLRASETFVKTHDNTKAELNTLVDQHTFAEDKSDIYFYNESVSRADFMAESGSVFREYSSSQ
jgi:hypothetical protein